MLFCNNEDFNNPVTRIWFVPAEAGRYGCVYVGFDNGWAQGGMNEKGLAFDWVAGYEGSPVVYTDEKKATGNPSERMLESCANVYEAIAFFKEYREPSFPYAKILVADPGGTSVMIESRDGILNFVIKTGSRASDMGRKSWT